MRTVDTLKLWASDLVGLFIPRRCAGCDTPLMRHEECLCGPCLADLPFTRFHDDPLNPVERLFHGRVQLQAASALLQFNSHGKVQRILHRIKYAQDTEAARFMGRLMGEALGTSARFAGADALLAIPLHPRKQRQRGYNQSRLLCDGMREVLPLAPLHHALARGARTETQTRKGRLDRWRNVRDAFVVRDPKALEGRHVLLVDDVVTTGATIEACAAALVAVPGVRVSLFTAACA
ncbi:MAG: phosphoribosyltransferase family protein [Flavobacteriales bacterium]|nr:MAG: phosphoribosyltransferase family protein [Flavobacteriales bacterium]